VLAVGAAADGLLCDRALAQPDPGRIKEAQALFEEAGKEMDAKKYSSACPKMERVVELVPEGVGAKLALAECYEGMGRLASAHRAYGEAEITASAAGQTARRATAKERREALEPKLAKVTVVANDVVTSIPGLIVILDGSTVRSLGAPVAVDAGEHVVIAIGRDRGPWMRRFSLQDGQARSVRVGVPPLLRGPDEAAGPDATESGAGAAGAAAAEEDTPIRYFGAQRIAGVALGGAGLAAAVVGFSLGGVAMNKRDESNAAGGCDADTDVCTTRRGVELRDESITLGNAATGVLVAAGTLGATGLVVYFTSPDPEPQAGAVDGMTIMLGVEPLGAALRARF
jgi:hypothetical protein